MRLDSVRTWRDVVCDDPTVSTTTRGRPMRMTLFSRLFAACGLLLLSANLLAAAEFVPLGFEVHPNNFVAHVLMNVSEDGSAVVGGGQLWTRKTGARPLQYQTLDSDVSGDGSTLVTMWDRQRDVWEAITISRAEERCYLCRTVTPVDAKATRKYLRTAAPFSASVGRRAQTIEQIVRWTNEEILCSRGFPKRP